MTDYVKAPTSSLSTGLALGGIAFVFLQAAGLCNGVGHYFKRFVTPAFFMLPLLLLDEFIKPASLALRLYGNVFGEVGMRTGFLTASHGAEQTQGHEQKT